MINEEEVQKIYTLFLSDSKNAALGLELLKGQSKETKAAVQAKVQPLLDGFKKKTIRGITGIWKAIEKDKLNQAERGAVWGIPELNKAIEKVDMYGIHWTALPTTVGQLKSLKLLRIMESKITELPKEIEGLTNLEKLDFSFNPLSKIPKSIGNLKQLKILRLSGNGRYLTRLPDEIGEMEGLEELLLAQNALKKLPDSIGKLQQLKVLDIHSNQLKTLPKTIGTLKSLDVLNVSGNNITAIPAVLHQLPNLKSLNVANQETPLSNFDFLKGLDALEELNMNACPPEIAHLTNLKRLELRDDAITDIPSEVGHLEKL